MARFQAVLGLLLGWYCLLVGAVARADDAASIEPSRNLTFDGSARLRYERIDWFLPPSSALEASYGFSHAKLQLGSKYHNGPFTAYVQMQEVVLLDLPENGIGPGAVYYSVNDDDRHPESFSLRQSYFELRQPDELPVAAKLGRFLYSSGGELVSRAADLEKLKQQRLHNRMLGPFDYTFGRSFDGALTEVKFTPNSQITAAYFRPTQGGFRTDISTQIDDIEVAAATYTKEMSWAGSGELQTFYYYYDDSRDDSVIKTDNRPQVERASDIRNIEVHSLGVSYVHVAALDEIALDGLAWGVLQGGRWGSLDHHAGAVALESGLTAKALSTRPRLSVGLNWGSGDGDAEDNDHETFFQMLPTARQYAPLPFYNAMNNQDVFVRLSAEPFKSLRVSSSVHDLRRVEGTDLLYSGGGANSRDQFGYAGASLSSSRALGQLYDLELSWALRKGITLSFYYGFLDGQSALDDFEENDIHFGYVELDAKLST